MQTEEFSPWPHQNKQMGQVTFSEEGILSSQPHHLEAIGRTEQHVPRVTAQEWQLGLQG